MVSQSFWNRTMHRYFLQRIWDREVRIMTAYWQQRMRKNKKFKPLFEKVKQLTPLHSTKFLSEYYFACKLLYKTKMDLETLFNSGKYETQLESVDEENW
jgi:hypothetical protein